MNSIAEELITRGWHQGSFEGDDGSVCLMGAAAYAAGVIPIRANLHVWVSVREALFAETGTYNIHLWNDAPWRTFDEVLRIAKIVDEELSAS